MFGTILHSVMNKQGAVAGAAIVSPVWLGNVQGALMSFSDYAAAALPILGCLWIVVQMGLALAKHRVDKGE